MKKHSLLLALFVLSATVFLTTSCEVEEKDYEKFLGTYIVDETCDGGSMDNYEIVISENNTGPSDVQIFNLYDVGESLTANVSGDKITIGSQSTFLVTFEGSGTLTGDDLTIDFTVDIGFGVSTCVAEGTRKE